MLRKRITVITVILGLLLAFFLKNFFQKNIAVSALHELNTGIVRELDALQTSRGSFLVAAMENQDSSVLKYNCTIYRSANLGVTWNKTLVIDDTSSNTRQYADPRLVENRIDGKIYLVLMRVRFQQRKKMTYQIPKKPYQSDLVVYRSEDNGQNWTFVSTPHIDGGDLYADLPYLVIDDQGCLLLIASHLNLKYLLGPSEIVIAKSCDEGNTWPTTYTFADSTLTANRRNLGNIRSTGKQSVAAVFSDEINLYSAILSHKDIFQLESIHSLSHPFNSKGLPISFLYLAVGSAQKGIICYLPHRRDSPIWYAAKLDGGDDWHWKKIADSGAYPNVLIDQNGIVHLAYSTINQEHFQLLYTYSKDQGRNFSKPVEIHGGQFQYFAAGEYQAILADQEGRLHLIFCDWSDGSKAKHLSLEPL